MQAIFASIVAVVGTLLGSLLTYVLQRKTTEESSRNARRERRRKELEGAIDGFSSAASALRRAEYDRGKKRIAGDAPVVREEARQEMYRRRTETWTAYYRLRLRADPHMDEDLLRDAELVIKLLRRITAYTDVKSEMEQRSKEAEQAIGDPANADMPTFA